MWALRRFRDTPSCALKLLVSPRRYGRYGIYTYGRYTWQHNKVLKEVVEATKMAVAIANSRIMLQRKVYFLREGFSLPCKKNRLPPRRDILAEANDWTVAADLEGLRHYPQLLRDSGRRPYVVIASSSSSDAFILVELTVPREDRIEASNVLKTEKYSDERSGG